MMKGISQTILWAKYKKEVGYLQGIAKKNPGYAGAKVASVIMARNGTFLGEGVNKGKTHTLQKRFAKNSESIHMHAEIDAISRVSYTDRELLRDSTLFVVRVHKNGELSMAKPCIGCMRAILAFNIPRVIYTNFSGNLEEIRINPKIRI